MARWHVVVTVSREGADPVVLRIDHSPVTIGGSADSDIVLAGPDVSRTHATVTVSAGRLHYRDRSSNGSFVNGRRVEDTVLAAGDAVIVPPYRLTFELTETVDDGHATRVLGSPAERPRQTRMGGAPVPAAPPTRPSPANLRLTRAPAALQGRAFGLDAEAGGPPILVGRAVEAHVCLDLPSVSRRHARLTHLPDGRWQIDDGSRNGISVNGRAVTTALLHDGDEIAFGPDLAAVFQHAPAVPAHDAPSADGALALTTRRSSVDAAVMVMSIAGRVDGYNYSEFRDRINQLIDAGHHRLLLDFERCAFCDHVGLSVVLSAKTALDKQRGGLCLIGVDRKLREGLSLLRLDMLLAVEPDEPAGVRRLTR